MGLGVGATIGTGLYVQTGFVANEFAGPSLILSFLLAAIGCGFAALCYSELASMVPVAGSAYTYAYATLGELVAWIIGWDLILEYAIGSSVVAAGWSNYLDAFLRECLPHPDRPATDLGPLGLRHRAWGVLPQDGDAGRRADGPGLVQPAGGVHHGGRHGRAGDRRQGKRGLERGDGAAQHRGDSDGRGHRVAPTSTRRTGGPSCMRKKGWRGVAEGAGRIFFAYIGFDSISTHAEEARRPQRDLAIGIMGALTICTILYVAVAAVLTGMVPYRQIDINAPLSAALQAKGLTFAGGLITLGILAGMTSSLLVGNLSQPRILLAMARDGLLPPGIFAAVHPRFKTPWKSTILVGVVVAAAAALAPLGFLADLVSIGTLFAFVIVSAAVWILRITDPATPRPFRAPWVPFVSTMGILVNGGMMFFLGPGELAAAVRLAGAGAVDLFRLQPPSFRVAVGAYSRRRRHPERATFAP